MGPIATAVTERGDTWRDRILTDLYDSGPAEAWDRQLCEKSHALSPSLRDYTIFSIATETRNSRDTWMGRHLRSWWGLAR